MLVLPPKPHLYMDREVFNPTHNFWNRSLLTSMEHRSVSKEVRAKRNTLSTLTTRIVVLTCKCKSSSNRLALSLNRSSPVLQVGTRPFRMQVVSKCSAPHKATSSARARSQPQNAFSVVILSPWHTVKKVKRRTNIRWEGLKVEIHSTVESNLIRTISSSSTTRMIRSIN